MNVDYLSAAIRISVPSFKASSLQQNTMFFTVLIESQGKRWSLEKRFSQFDNLAKAIKNSYHDVPILPNKSFIFKMTDKDLEARRKGLEEFLRKIAIRNDLINSEAVKTFLQLDKNVSQLMTNPPKLVGQYSVEGNTKGIRDFVYVEDRGFFIFATGDTSPMNKINAKVTNTKLPWENDAVTNMMEVGSVEVWKLNQDSKVLIKQFVKGYPKQATCVSFDKASNRVVVGLEDGVIDVLMLTNNNSYEDLSCVKVHQSRVTGASYDSVTNIVYSTSQDKIFRISHGSSLAMVVSLPHREQLMSMLRDQINKRVFVGTKTGQVAIYDVSQPEKPKLLNTISNNFKGSIRSMQFELKRNYLFTLSYDDGEVNVFDLYQPGRQKLAKLNATLRGKQKARAIAWAPKRMEIMTGTADGCITFWSSSDDKPIYVLQSFEEEITRLEYLEDQQTLISSSKGKSIKFWKLPKEWRDARLIAKLQKEAGKAIAEMGKERIMAAAKNAEEDSDEDDLLGWHLD